MSAPLYCPRCGTANVAGARFCITCGSPMPMVGPQVPVAPVPSAGPIFQHPPAYNYAAIAAQMGAQKRAGEIDRTKTGLLLLLIGALISPTPFVGIVGSILILVGAILVIVGRNVFGPKHARNTIWSIIIFVIGIVVAVVTALILVFSSIASNLSNGLSSGSSSSIAAQAAASTLQGLLIGTVVGSLIGGVAYVLFTYELQRPLGRRILFSAYAAGIAIGIVEFIIIYPQINTAAQQVSSTGTVDAINSLSSQLQTLGLLSFIPAILYAGAFYLAWSRIKTGEIPSPVP